MTPERQAALDLAAECLAYDALLRNYSGPQPMLGAGDCAKIDAAYDALMAKAKAVARAVAATPE